MDVSEEYRRTYSDLVGEAQDRDEEVVRGLVAEVERIRAAVQEHHDQKGDNRCHLDDLKLYHAVLGAGVDPYVGALPPDADMEESCRRYIRQRRCPGPQGVVPLPGDMTIAQLTAAVERIEAENRRLKARVRDLGQLIDEIDGFDVVLPEQ